MKKSYLISGIIIFLFFLFICNEVTSINSQDVLYKIKIEYIPSCSLSCVNSTTANNIENNISISNKTTENCNNYCGGIIKISPGEGDNSNQIFGAFNLTEVNGSILTGAKNALIGNISDITRIAEEFEKCNNISGQLIMFEALSNVTQNLTTCMFEKGTLNSNLVNCNSNLQSVNTNFNNQKNNLWIYPIIAFALGVAGYWKFNSFIQGKKFSGPNLKEFNPRGT